MDKKRSPRHPQIGLQEALEKIKLVYEKEHTHKVGREVVAKDLGYSGLNGKSAAVIASLRQYNLLEQAGEALKVSDDAVTILELPIGNPERAEAINRVAFAPKLFAEFKETFGLKPPSDDNLRLSLVRQGFNKGAADSVIRIFRDVISLVQEQGISYNPESVLPVARQSMETLPHQQLAQQVIPTQRVVYQPISKAQETFKEDNVSEKLHYRLSDECRVRVLFEGSVTKEAINKLIAYLKLGVEDFPSKRQEEKGGFQKEKQLLPFIEEEENN